MHAMMMTVLLAASPVTSTATGNFCQRMASDLGMKLVGTPAAPDVWEVQTRTLGMFLLGGTYTISIGVGPPNEPTLDDYKRLEGVCKVAPKGAACSSTGPAMLVLRTRNKELSVEAKAGERADVRIISTRIRCENRQSAMTPSGTVRAE